MIFRFVADGEFRVLPAKKLHSALRDFSQAVAQIRFSDVGEDQSRFVEGFRETAALLRTHYETLRGIFVLYARSNWEDVAAHRHEAKGVTAAATESSPRSDLSGAMGPRE